MYNICLKATCTLTTERMKGKYYILKNECRRNAFDKVFPVEIDIQDS
jgi:hypothetical protein